MITPKDIETKEFKVVKLGGFAKEDVNQFLDEIAVDMDALIKENATLKEELLKIKETVDKKASTESSLYETLESAKSLMNEIAASAERRAEVLLHNAELDSEIIKRDAREAVAKYTQEGNRLKGRVSSLRDRYIEMLNQEIKRVSDTSEDFLKEFEEDFVSEKKECCSETKVYEEAPVCEESDLKKTVIIEKVKGLE
ncbi:MAG: DivIVA domain-containing protein [Clostridia bacterium]|nr:DivIVA domain-containing protein [Clostridia bacterium]